MLSRLYVHPPVQSSARGNVSWAQLKPARERRSSETFFIAVSTTTNRTKASVRKIMKFHDERSLRYAIAFDKFFLLAILITPIFSLLTHRRVSSGQIGFLKLSPMHWFFAFQLNGIKH